MSDVVIVSAARTPIGTFNGGLGSLAASDLGCEVIRAVLQRADLDAEAVSDVIMGHVLTAGTGQNPARQAAIAAGIPVEKTALTINQVCGSGLRAVAMGYQAVLTGDSDIMIAGGQESMSRSTHCAYLRSGQKMGQLEMVDSMIKDGLWDAFKGYHMGNTAENVANKYKISREAQDVFAANSQRKTEAAQKSGHFTEEIVPVTVKTRKSETEVKQDEFPRHGTTAEKLAELRPAFAKDGSVTAGNASGLNDGAAAMVLMSATEAERRGIEPLARIVAWATAGVDPSIMGTGPIPASRRALKKAAWSVSDLDLVEANEAFAASTGGERGNGLGSIDRKCEWRGDCAWPPNWGFRCTYLGNVGA